MPDWIILHQSDRGITRASRVAPQSFADTGARLIVEAIVFEPEPTITRSLFDAETVIRMLAILKPEALASVPEPTKRRIVLDPPSAPPPERSGRWSLVTPEPPRLRAPAPDTPDQPTLTDQDCVNLLRVLMAAHRFVYESSRFEPDNTYQAQLKSAVDTCMEILEPAPGLRVATDLDVTQSQIDDRVRAEVSRVERALAENCTCPCNSCTTVRSARLTGGGRVPLHCFREQTGCAIVPF